MKIQVLSDLHIEFGEFVMPHTDADLIIFIYRDQVYNKNSEAWGTAEIIVSKQRNGPTDTVRLAFLGEFTRFENYAGMGSSGDF